MTINKLNVPMPWSAYVAAALANTWTDTKTKQAFAC